MQQIDEQTFSTLKERMGQKFPILLQGYLRDAQQYLVTIEANLLNGDLQEIIHASHSLKSASGLLGIVGVSDASEKIEYEAKAMGEHGNPNYSQLSASYSELQNDFSVVQAELETRQQSIQNEFA